jgi:hypothetical protein
VHTDAALLEYEPSAHTVHDDAPLDTPVEVPAKHGEQDDVATPLA